MAASQTLEPWPSSDKVLLSPIMYVCMQRQARLKNVTCGWSSCITLEASDLLNLGYLRVQIVLA